MLIVWLSYFKRLDTAEAPWLSESEFSVMEIELRAWRSSLPATLQLDASAIYIRRESSQLGALIILHCIYHQTVYDLYRIGLPELFNIREPLDFPPDQRPFQARLTSECFSNAQQIATILSIGMQHGSDILADTKLPTLTYNANRVMLYYLARYVFPNSDEAFALFQETVRLIESNNTALRTMSPLFPLANSLVMCIP